MFGRSDAGFEAAASRLNAGVINKAAAIRAMLEWEYMFLRGDS
jgi:hypothetical protein